MLFNPVGPLRIMAPPPNDALQLPVQQGKAAPDEATLLGVYDQPSVTLDNADLEPSRFALAGPAEAEVVRHALDPEEILLSHSEEVMEVGILNFVLTEDEALLQEQLMQMSGVDLTGEVTAHITARTGSATGQGVQMPLPDFSLHGLKDLKLKTRKYPDYIYATLAWEGSVLVVYFYMDAPDDHRVVELEQHPIYKALEDASK